MKYNLKPDERATLEIRGLYEKYGYKKYKLRKFEEYSFYVNNHDFLTEKKVLTFTDLDGRLLAMKPDVTLSVINNTGATDEKTEKLYYIENVYREDKESHCFKEISQMGLEYLGKVDKYSILEVMELAIKSLETIDEDFLIEISHMQYTVHLLESLSINEEDNKEILEAIRQKNAMKIKEICIKAGLNDRQIEVLTELPFLYGEIDEVLIKARDYAINDEMNKDLDELEEYCKAINELGCLGEIQVDLSMINDIEYYNGIIFKGYIRKLPGCVLAGGQYDNAMTILNKKGKAVGFALYLDELNKGEHKINNYDADALLVYDDNEPMIDVMKAVNYITDKGLSAIANNGDDEEIRYKEKYRLSNKKIIKEGF